MAKLQIQRFVVLVALGLSLLLSACSGGSGGTKPVITSFTAAPTTINRGETSTLTWDVSGATALSIDNAVGSVTGQTSKEVSPAATTTYTLTASNGAENVSRTATVTVATSQACTDPVAVPDANLAQEIRETLGKASGELTCADMARLTELGASQQKIASVEGLQYAVNLFDLELDRDEVSDVSPLIKLSKLERLNLNNNQISDLTLFANFTSLRDLYICCSNPYTDISPLAGLTNLEELDIGGHNLGDISILEGFDKLERVWVWGNDLDDDDMDVFEGKALELLHLAGNNIANLAFLTAFTELETLDLRNNDITDISALVANSGIVAGDTVDVSQNFLDLSAGSDDMMNIQALLDRGVDLTFDPQNQPADIEGSGSITQTVTESTRAGVDVGDEVTSTIVFTVSGNSVTATNQPSGTTSSGTLDGNHVSLVRTGMDADAFTVTAELIFDQDSVSGTAVQTFANGDEVRRSASGTRQ